MIGPASSRTALSRSGQIAASARRRARESRLTRRLVPRVARRPSSSSKAARSSAVTPESESVPVRGRPDSSRRRNAAMKRESSARPSVARRRIRSMALASSLSGLSSLAGPRTCSRMPRPPSGIRRFDLHVLTRREPLSLAQLLSVPDPGCHEHRVDAGAARELTDRKSRQRRITAPLALAGHHEIEIERRQQPHALGAHVAVDADEDFVEEYQARRMRIGAGIVSGGRGELRYRERERLFASGARAVGRAGEASPLPVLVAEDGKAVPSPVVERCGQLVPPRTRLVRIALRPDALLQEAGKSRPLIDGPERIRAQELTPGRFESRRAVGIGLPDKLQLHACARRARRELPVGILDPALGIPDQALQFRSRLAEEMVLDHLPLALIEQALAQCQIIGEDGVEL